MGTHVDEVGHWESVNGQLPRSLAKRLDWVLANISREQELERAGSPVCPWVTEEESRLDTSKLNDLEAFVKAVEAHEESCDLCQRREEFVKDLPPPPPPPMPPHLQALMALGDRINKLPSFDGTQY